MSGMAKTGIHCYRLLAIVVLLGSVVRTQVSVNEISGFSLSPKYFNLATQARISATATCGEDKLGRPRSDLYCKLVGGPTTELYSHNIQGQFCEHCNSNNPTKSHPITNAIDGTETWWQSPPLSRGLEYNEVNVTLDLGQLFHVAYVLIKFANSPRPDLWVLERSVDHGRTFTPWQYFAHSKRECIERFGKQPNKYIIGDDEQICTTEYSRIVPLENGEIVVSLINRRPGSNNFTHSPALQEFTKATNIRLHFLRTSTLLGHLISKAQRDPSVTRRYYYSIKDISVGGRCVCHGHALECGGPSRQDQRQCDCQHNTCGDSCDRCCPGYHQKPWRPATADSANECQPCQCHSHATDCYYDTEVERRRASLDIYARYDGGGVCLNCQHNTAGVNCERCVEGYYRPYGVPRESPTGCIPCRCDPQSTQGCEMGSGRCTCRPEFSGDYCNQCADGYYGYPKCIRYPIYPATTRSPSDNIKEPKVCSTGYFGAPSCRPCLCERQGTVPEVCTASGRCLCRPGIIGERCDRCHEGFHSFPYCQECRCDGHGVADRSCGPRGECRCRANYAGQQCEQCATGHYEYPYCSVCQCDPEGSQGGACDPASGQCVCRPGVTGRRCDRCSNPGLQFPYCTVCQCDPEGSQGGACDPASGQCVCRPGVTGQRCDRCSNPGLQFPYCTVCQCDPEGSHGGACDPASGQCVCRPGVTGQPCDRCSNPGLQFPDCTVCLCHPEGSQGGACDPPSGQCACRPGVTGQYCDRCSNPGLQFPDCTVCLCHPEGSQGGACDPASGQCVCRPGVTGQRCDRCSNPSLQFPYCTGPTPAPSSQCNQVGSEVGIKVPQGGSCVCRRYVEGPRCDRCKPLFWNLARDNPSGCIECMCGDKGTLSGVGECQQETGECYCKPNTCSHSCSICKESHFLLQRKNYFGCQGCQCDVGGAVGSSCDDQTGQCQCRKNIRGRSCDEPETNHYFPSLHHLKVEVENGITPNARPVRFGYEPQVFPQFSWRGYAIMSPAQSEVSVSVHVDEAHRSAFRLLLRYANPGTASVTGRITASRSRGGAGESREVVFPPSRAPALLTVPGDGFAQPFTLNPGKWNLHIQAEGILLDYLVLLPSDYYEAPILQETVTEPCTYTKVEQHKSCLLYKHVPMERFPFVLGSEGLLSVRGRRRRGRRQARTRRPTADHPEMASISGRQAQLQLMVHVPRPGLYAVVLEYASEVDMVQNINLHVKGHSQDEVHARANIYSCTYSFLCRSVAVDGMNRVAKLQMAHRTELLLQTSTASFLLHKVYVVPAEEFSMEHVDPKVLCVSEHGRFTDDCQVCVQSQFPSVPSAVLLDPTHQAPRPSGPRGEGVLLKSPQTKVTVSGRVPDPGRYVLVVHTRQPEHTAFPVEVLIDAGMIWKGWLNASFCPAMSGCRSVFITERRIALDVPQRELAITLRIPPGKTLTLDYILAVPDDRYTPDLMKAKPLDKAPDFIAQCGGESFQIDPSTASEFCRASARSLVALHHNGALPCYCDKSGSTSPTCEPLGGQCRCRPHVIGRQCTRCATGYYGFPYCRPCQCGRRRLCDEVTGECICPPQTVRPACDTCNSQTFSYHPLVGCDHCDCSPTGIVSSSGDCDSYTGQCTCKPRIGGRQCDRCAAGYFRFPECVPCDCETGGVRPEVCDPNTGQCLCKRNVEGERCDSCRRGSFHFDPANPSGCIECFCFKTIDQCHSSSKRRGKFVDMHNWRLEKADLEEVPSVLNPISNMVVADVQEVPRSVQSLHWVAPPSYLGDRVSSYGGYLTYQTKSFGIPSEGMLPLDKKPDLLLSGDQMTLVYFDPQSPDPDRLYQGRVQLVEGNLRHAGTRRPVSREELLRVLAALEDVRVRALYFTQSQRLSLGDVGLEEASRDGRGAPASTVEECSCPPQYSGDSCQKCARGFYRDRSAQLPGRCVPCSCNGLSDECEEGTGRCLNCQHNAAGDHCERCHEGYYGNPAQRSCRLCPCPLTIDSNSFATGCREVSGRMQCICKPGYTGERCQSCAPGYYGDPMAYRGSCSPCNCNGNPGHCDSKTGVCKDTLPKDTNTDEQCQECDNCAQTLLSDLEKLDDELARIKSQLEKANASSSSQERLRKLEEAITAAKIVVNTFTSTVDRQKSKVTDLELDTETLKDDINLLKKQAEEKKTDVDQALDGVEDTNQRAQNLNTQAQNMFKKIQDLLKQLQDASANGDSVAPNQLTKLLEEAERLVREMEGRNLNDQKDAAEKEKELAHKFLEHIQNNVTRQCDQNKEAATRVEGLLKDFEDRLKDLEEALTQAKSLVEKANNQNNLNSQAMQDLLNRIKDLEKERDNVAGQIAMAKEQLKDTGELLSTLDDSKQEYERLAAQVDGAKNDLTKRVNEISKAAAKEAIVKQAEEHAQKLSDLANQLEKAVNDSRGNDDVRNALAAIDAYKSIVDAIKAAEKAANEAKEAADKASQDVNQKDLVQKAKDLKDKGTKLVTSASDAEKDLKQAASDLADQKKRLEDANKKKQSLENDLQKAQDDLRGIQRDDIANMIDEAKKAAAVASDTATNAMGRLDDIKKEVEKINVGPGDSNLDSVLNEVDNSVKNLSSTIPSLLDKINQIEELSTQAGPVTNVSENIKRIKELIEQARDAANRVTVPMKFRGDSHVELRAPKNMDDLKAYTSLSLYLQRPERRGDGKRRRRQLDTDNGNLFVLYLGKKDASGDYIGMALRSNILYTVYKLNGVEYEVESDTITGSASEQAMFDKVDLFRIYQDAEVIITKAFTSNNPLAAASAYKQGEHAKNLLNIDPKDVVFYVGGYPDSFTPPASLNYPKYKGCIELSTFNERFVSLYNFQKAVNIEDTPCKRYVPSVSTDFFEGTGYAKVDASRYLSSTTLRFNQFITTRSENGIVMYIGNEDSYYTISLEKGHFVVNGQVNGQDLSPIKSEKKHTPLNQDVLIRLTNSDKSLRVIHGSSIVVTATNVPEDFKDFYIGGVPDGLRDRFNIRVQPLKACVKTVKVNGGHADLVEKVGVSKGCPEDFLASRKAECKAGGTLEKALDKFSLDGNIVVSLGFRSTEADGLLLTKTEQETGLELTMVNGHVVMKFVGQTIKQAIKSKKQYQDGQWHYVTARKRDTGIELLIDENDSGEPHTETPSLTSSSENVILGAFKGCLSNLYTRRSDYLYRPEDLSEFSTTGEVFLDECTAERPPENMLASLNHSFSRKDNKEEDDFVSGCSLPTQVKHAYYLGGAASGLTYKVSKQDLQNKPHFSVDVRTTSAEGLLFYVGSDLENGHLALYMSKGRIRLSVRRKREIFNRERYNDGKWHTVIFSLEKKRFRLLVDGIRAQDGVLTHVESSDIQLMSPLYLGSAPPSLHEDLKWKNLPKEGVVGCIRNFKMNGLPVGEPTTNHGVGPCFDGQTESGSYFSGNGGYVIIDESFVVGESFELVFEVRPRNLTGVLLHVGNQHHLSLYMRRGEVVAQVNNGVGIFSVSVWPKQSLCDGVFHRVAVIKRKNVVEMHVDTDGNYTIGSTSSTTTMTKDPLYVGGIPGTFKGVVLPVRTSFRGCIQNMQINGELVAFERLPKVFGSVNLRECPAG
ncbi:laminin subunit alpha-3-like isoform X1 [Alosa sapidissima]|uniref:laminin subunit alpha-3-like isoform X1 n=1 Tax=Alosa sapidissima TaxID=34773 RepID=UPI001C083B0A|nr:laminin subunit alpha-3-like isoform X1 [Alosa sapidissima]